MCIVLECEYQNNAFTISISRLQLKIKLHNCRNLSKIAYDDSSFDNADLGITFESTRCAEEEHTASDHKSPFMKWAAVILSHAQDVIENELVVDEYRPLTKKVSIARFAS